MQNNKEPVKKVRLQKTQNIFRPNHVHNGQIHNIWPVTRRNGNPVACLVQTCSSSSPLLFVHCRTNEKMEGKSRKPITGRSCVFGMSWQLKLRVIQRELCWCHQKTVLLAYFSTLPVVMMHSSVCPIICPYSFLLLCLSFRKTMQKTAACTCGLFKCFARRTSLPDVSHD